MITSEWAHYLSDEAEVGQQPEEVATAVVERMAERYAQALPLIPGATEAVGRLGDRWPLGLASSSPRSLMDSVLATTRLTHRFTVTVSTEEMEHGKPSPDVYRAAVRGPDLSPERCVAVEDSTNGLRAAVGAGLVAVAFHLPSADALDAARVVAIHLDELTASDLEGLGEG